MTEKELVSLAFEAKKKSYSPYSKFKVGAALLCDDGSVYLGCNIENASYGATNCAERTAIFKAVSDGKRNFCMLAVVGDEFALPCGICRQVIAEFCGGDFPIIVADENEAKRYTLLELLPSAFSGDSMNRSR